MVEILKKGNKLGEGAYGRVYEITVKDEDGEYEMALKRNHGDKYVTGIKTLKEADMLSALRGHEFVLYLEDFTDNSKFNGKGKVFSPVKESFKKNNMTDDKLHFIMERCDEDLGDIIDMGNKDYHPTHLKQIMIQILLGIEYIHSQGIIHRDIKPDNILISWEEKDGNEVPVAKITDFGLSKFHVEGGRSTPGLYTCIYRPPEVCAGWDYCYKSDVFAIGLVFYEMIKRRPLCDKKIGKDYLEHSKDIFPFWAEISPEVFTKKYLNSYVKKGKKGLNLKNLSSQATSKNKKSLKNILDTSEDKIEKFNKTDGTYEQFLDLLGKMLKFDPANRITVSEAIEHPFFDYPKIKEYINIIRTNFNHTPKRPLEDKNIIFFKCKERTWIWGILKQITADFAKARERKFTKVSEIACLFHTVEIFDRYFIYKRSTMEQNKVRDEETGRYFNKSELEFIVKVCFYVYYKYYSTMSECVEFEFLLSRKERKVNLRSLIDKMEKTELEILVYGLRYHIYRDTIFEIELKNNPKFENVTEEEAHYSKLLETYATYNEYYEGNVVDLLECVKKKISDDEV